MVNYGKYKFINEDEVLKVLPKIQEFKGELPLVLFDYIDVYAYLGNVSPKVAKGFYDRKHDIQIVDNPLEYMKFDLSEWVKENPQFEKIYVE